MRLLKTKNRRICAKQGHCSEWGAFQNDFFSIFKNTIYRLVKIKVINVRSFGVPNDAIVKVKLLISAKFKRSETLICMQLS